MADEEKKKKGSRDAAGKADRKRLNYLRERGKELRKEQQAIKTETGALRAKLGMTGGEKAGGGKAGGGKAGGGKGKKNRGGGGGDDED
jgi:hypothetical protein